jgi:hypothetical protein
MLRAEAHRVGLERLERSVGAEDLVLVGSPSPIPGRKISQMPDAPRRRIGWRRPSQVLKAPTTETRRAFGAQTAKWVP